MRWSWDEMLYPSLAENMGTLSLNFRKVRKSGLVVQLRPAFIDGAKVFEHMSALLP